MTMVMTAPEIMYTDITHAARDSSTPKSSAITGIAGDRDVCKKRIRRVVPVSITTDFHAAKEISSDLVVAVLLSKAVDISPNMDRLYINLMLGVADAVEGDEEEKERKKTKKNRRKKGKRQQRNQQQQHTKLGYLIRRKR
jgi:hypothetical protein